MGAAIIPPAGPTSPLSYVESRGSLRQLPDGTWTTWDGHDWIPTVLPIDQLSKPPVVPDNDGVVRLPSGLYAVGEIQSGGDIVADADLWGAEVHLGGPPVWRPLSRLPKGLITNSEYTASAGTATVETYAGAGVIWNFETDRRTEIRAEITISATGGSATDNLQARLRGGPYNGAVDLTSPVLMISEVTVGAQGTARHHLEWEAPQNWAAAGDQMYVVVTAMHSSGATGSYSTVRNSTTPVFVRRYDVGAW